MGITEGWVMKGRRKGEQVMKGKEEERRKKKQEGIRKLKSHY